MSQDALDMLAARLRALLAEQGLAALQTALDQQASRLPPEQYARLERMIAGVDTSPPPQRIQGRTELLFG